MPLSITIQLVLEATVELSGRNIPIFDDSFRSSIKLLPQDVHFLRALQRTRKAVFDYKQYLRTKQPRTWDMKSWVGAQFAWFYEAVAILHQPTNGFRALLETAVEVDGKPQRIFDDVFVYDILRQQKVQWDERLRCALVATCAALHNFKRDTHQWPRNVKAWATSYFLECYKNAGDSRADDHSSDRASSTLGDWIVSSAATGKKNRRQASPTKPKSLRTGSGVATNTTAGVCTTAATDRTNTGLPATVSKAEVDVESKAEAARAMAAATAEHLCHPVSTDGTLAATSTVSDEPAGDGVHEGECLIGQATTPAESADEEEPPAALEAEGAGDATTAPTEASESGLHLPASIEDVFGELVRHSQPSVAYYDDSGISSDDPEVTEWLAGQQRAVSPTHEADYVEWDKLLAAADMELELEAAAAAAWGISDTRAGIASLTYDDGERAMCPMTPRRSDEAAPPAAVGGAEVDVPLELGPEDLETFGLASTYSPQQQHMDVTSPVVGLSISPPAGGMYSPPAEFYAPLAGQLSGNFSSVASVNHSNASPVSCHNGPFASPSSSVHASPIAPSSTSAYDPFSHLGAHEHHNAQPQLSEQFGAAAATAFLQGLNSISNQGFSFSQRAAIAQLLMDLRAFLEGGSVPTTLAMLSGALLGAQMAATGEFLG